ncbi:BMP family ABC transporter substrate-binding protein [Enterococcus saccharolyticus]|uniref:BMP family ABC transporter substrate-binding protein n=1 Tax=Candidatus Enterococcus willemsii TaxID=1857215 RepID=A0ABQ6Z0H2_9ENTE|nr:MULTISPECIES: BMP family ABC transporter substrate-binding protein [Enterococcus]KAF1304357.1 BMP family ABC transporter substrate-binding protein [Enterococcus sp. CU12B]MCD5002273.1 BMP family ABC transporter substrate-binding protein [Enterococcus saccharolyticus]
MKRTKLFGLGVMTMLSALVLGACGNGGTDSSDKEVSEKPAATIALITNAGGVDDRSFNQSAWEGFQAWGKENGFSEGNDGYKYFQSANESDYVPNIDQALSAGFNTIFGIGYRLAPAIQEQAELNPDKNFVMVDEVIDLPNVASVTFKDHEASYLAGVAAAYTTKTNKVGFIGGIKGEVIGRFEAGFNAGVQDAAKTLGKDITVENQYAGSFDLPDRGRSIAQGIYGQGADVIFHASGGTGSGIFQEAKARNESDSEKVWVIGVDSDQESEGEYQKDGKADNFTLTSTLKGVGTVAQDLAQKALDGEFPGGEHQVYGLKEDGVDLTAGHLSDEAKAAVEEAREKIISGEIEVPEK